MVIELFKMESQVTANNRLDNERKIGDPKSTRTHESKTVFVRMPGKELEMSIIEPSFRSTMPIINGIENHNLNDECVNGNFH